MSGAIAVEATWDGEAGVWTATSPDTPGLVVEAATWTDMMAEVRLVLPELLQLQSRPESVVVTFRAEESLNLAVA